MARIDYAEDGSLMIRDDWFMVDIFQQAHMLNIEYAQEKDNEHTES